MQITLAQREALDVIKDMIDRSNTSVPDYGTKIMTLILGILNVDCRVEHTTTDIVGDKNDPIPNPNIGNDKIPIGAPNWPDWIKPTPPFALHCQIKHIEAFFDGFCHRHIDGVGCQSINNCCK